MAKRFIFLAFLTAFFFCWTAISHAYTVVLKNGKVMKGKLISETAEGIVFRDEGGFQFSLKKSALDLDKMKEANEAEAAETAKAEEAAPAAEPAPETAPEPEQPSTAPKSSKKARVYTKEDLDKLKERYGELTTGTPIENPEDYSSAGILKPDAYLKAVRSAATQLTQIQQNLDVLSAGVSTQWEVASSTGKNAAQAIDAYMKGESAAAIVSSYNTDFAAAEEARQRIGAPPRGYEPLAKNLATAMNAIHSYYDLIRGHSQVQNSSVFRSRVDEMKIQVNAAVLSVQGWQPPAPPAEQPAPPSTAPETEPTQTQESPS